MGCSLNKLEKHEEKRPGNIYSTLKRPQVETKIDVTYEYRFLEFTTLTAEETRANTQDTRADMPFIGTSGKTSQMEQKDQQDDSVGRGTCC
ncbi:raftlin [Cricetulus griseus]|uniref:Raftlin n=1 Tax=Cricetulus griseus TaxID=10029 RepID=A0A061IN37_CRIGR|nr:raftlin [Cricetulus griseus]